MTHFLDRRFGHSYSAMYTGNVSAMRRVARFYREDMRLFGYKFGRNESCYRSAIYRSRYMHAKHSPCPPPIARSSAVHPS